MPDLELGTLVAATVAFIAAVSSVVVGYLLLFAPWRRGTGKERAGTLAFFLRHCRGPILLLATGVAASVGLSTAPQSSELAGIARHGITLVLISGVAWLIVRITAAAKEILLARFDVRQRDNRVARRIQTQALVFQRTVAVVVSVLAIAVMLTTFPQVRVMGASILASAGVAGLVVGLAAQSTLSNLLAGLQIAVTDPVRIDDVVVVEGEWGRIEEISFTYVVVRIWDERRLILPISYFTTRAFENWTRGRSDILGSVTVRVDYSVPVDEVRAELTRLVEASPLWDGRVVGLQVTEAFDHTIELRALVSASDSSSAWDLRCAVREGMIRFLQDSYPDSLPRMRAELVPSRNPAEADP